MSDIPLGDSASSLTQRGKEIVSNIQSLQKSEKVLFDQLQEGSSTMTMTKANKEAIVAQINNLTDTRRNLYTTLRSDQDFYKKNVDSAHNVLTQESDALEVVERELHRARNRVGLINDQRTNRLRLVEINRYYGDKYRHHTLILKYITLVFSLILVITYLNNQGLMPPAIFTTLFVIIGSTGLYMIIKEVYDAYSRDNMLYQQYSWKDKIPNEEPTAAETASTPSIFDKTKTEKKSTCIGQECCETGYTWVPEPLNKCIANTTLDDPKITKMFRGKIEPYDPANADSASLLSVSPNAIRNMGRR